ncbi:hypothetical protein GOP47_0005428 [Adiantum capillus-veneris]|uniref:non-specific serine/threonine protein kinase n=1 Tax=Adiantum capillus-veneris TaxID=13818 RepID=A0A9D4V539_ADICA|nr:hypothetical protein GOP47_0005428 [Adiantum capillus-veneris]
MRSRRSDYVMLSSQANDMPYHPLEPYTETAADIKPLPGNVHASANSTHSCIHDNGPRLDRVPSSNSKLSSIDKGLDLDRNHPLVSESIFGAQYGKARTSHFEWNSCVAADRFSLSIAGARTLTGSGLGLVDRVPVFAAGEYSRNQVNDHNFWSKDGSFPASCSLLQRQSSGGSCTDSLFSSDVPLSSISPTVSFSASDSALFGTQAEGPDGGKGIKQMSASSQQSWAQLTEQSYNLQLTLALRVVAEAEITEEPIMLPNYNAEVQPFFLSAGSSSMQATTLRFWVNGSLGYADRVRDGFFHIWGMNPYIWKLCSHTDEAGGRLPTLELLRAVNPSDSMMEVIVIDKHGDAHLCEMENQAFNFAYTAADSRELAKLLGKLVAESMGGKVASEVGDLMPRWKASSKALKECLSCVVFPIGSVSVGVCRHRALLFKALADSVNLPCRIARGCKYCGHDDGVSCLVLCGSQREFMVDLISSPGELSCPESFLKHRPAPSIVSPLRLPELKESEVSGSGGLEGQSSTDRGKSFYTVQSDQREGCHVLCGSSLNDVSFARTVCCETVKPGANAVSIASLANRASGTHQATFLNGHVNSLHKQLSGKMKESVSKKLLVAEGQKTAVHNFESCTEDKSRMPKQTLFEAGQLASMHTSFAEVDADEARNPPETSQGAVSKAKSLELSLALDGLEIGWEDLSVKERIGAGSFGTVHRADWHGSDVAVKVFIEQDFLEERLDEFMREVAIMKRTRHPNVVLFMGVVTKRPNFSIVTEYLPRGSLFRLLHRPGMRELLDERRRVRMALDVARGMNYLHRLNPPIVHRDLKSPNLLVDKTWTVKVCDFGLSRLKMKTFLSSRSAAGTAEWMAPEVLRDEPSNEKSDVYSFGVILWELFTLQQPWSGLSPAQVVGAVGFQHRRLLVPKDMNPDIAALIESCWANDPRQRPSFASIMESLKPLQRACKVQVLLL